MRRIGGLTMEVELLRAKMERVPGPFGPQEAAVVAETACPAAGRRYGVARVCRVWGVPRSSFYAARAATRVPAVAPVRRGPKPTISDADLLAASPGGPRALALVG